MSKKTLIAAAAGSAFVAGLAAAPLASAAENPFALSGLSSGYQVADHHGAKTVTQTEAETQTKAKEGKCGEGKCGAKTKTEVKTETKAMEGKCGEGKCGAKK